MVDDQTCHLYYMEKTENFRSIESIFIQAPKQLPAEKSYFPAIAILKLDREMVNLNSMLHTLDGPLVNHKNENHYSNGEIYSGSLATCYSHSGMIYT